MAIQIPPVFEQCWKQGKMALIFVNSDTYRSTGTVYPGNTLEDNTALLAVLNASNNERQMILPHCLQQLNPLQLGYSADPRCGNVLYPGPMYLNTSAQDREKPLPNWREVLAEALKGKQMPKGVDIWCTEHNLVARPTTANGRDLACWHNLLNKVATDLNASGLHQQLAVRSAGGGYILEAVGLLGTMRQVHDYIIEIGKHYQYPDSDTLFKEKIGCVIFISSDTSLYVERERQVVHSLMHDGQRIGYCCDVAVGPDRDRPHTDQVLANFTDITSFLERLVYYTPPEQHAAAAGAVPGW